MATRLFEVRESRDELLPSLWDVVEDAEVVEVHEGLDGKHRWYRVWFDPSDSWIVDSIITDLL